MEKGIIKNEIFKKPNIPLFNLGLFNPYKFERKEIYDKHKFYKKKRKEVEK
jgi:hypothetical protein